MANAKSVLLIGLQPTLLDYSSPDYAAFPGMNAAKVQAALDADASRLNDLGYEAQLCLTDFGETTEEVLSEALRKKPFDCVFIGAGVRKVGMNFLLFEKLINVVHRRAPDAKLCFNTKPDDTAEAVERWI